MNKYSYLLVGDSRGRDIANKKEEIMLSGLYLWSTAFTRFGKKGDIEPFWRKDDLEEYDIVHVNYTPSNIQLPTVIRNELGDNSSTKLVLNIDVDVTSWGPNWAYYVTELMREVGLADIVFHVEPHGAAALKHLTDKMVSVNPHPVDVSGLYDYIRPEREPMIGTIYHRYTADSMTPFIAQRKVPLRRVLFGYTPGKHNYVANQGMYDQILNYSSFKEYIEEVSKSAIGCDLYSGFTFGRAVVEFAALGIPAVVSKTIDASGALFPCTSVDPWDTEFAEETFMKLLNDPEFSDTVIKHAHSECKYYSLENSYQRFIEMIENR